MKSLAKFLIGSTLAATCGLAAAQYPDRPVTLVVPATAGDGSDLLARAIAKSLGEAMKQVFIVDNKPGAGGSLGAGVVAKAAADGYTLLLANGSSHGVTPSLYAKLPYDSLKDFAPIALIATAPNVLVASNKLGVNGYAAFAQMARQQPGKLTIAAASLGSLSHMSAELLKSTAGLDLLLVPYKGGAPALSDLMGGQVDSLVMNVPTVLPHIRSGKLKALAVTSSKRAGSLPEVPTLAESGLTGFDTVAWFGLMAPAGTSPELLNKLHGHLQHALQQPEIRVTLERLGADASGMGPREFSGFVKHEMAKYAAVIKSAAIKLD